MPVTKLGGMYHSDPQIVEGWREKTKLNNLQLSSFVPFLHLYSLLSPAEAAKYRSTPGGEIIKITLISADKKTTVVDGCRLAKLESQLDSSSQRGGAGLISASIQRGAQNSFNEIVEVRMNLSDYKIFDLIPVYQKLIERNSEYIIFYGWSTQNVAIPAVDNNRQIVFDENANTKGYWNFMKIVLFGYDYSFESDTSIAMTMNFYTQFGAAVAMTKSGLYGDTVINALKSFTEKDSKNSDLGAIANNIVKLKMPKDKTTDNPGIIVQSDRQITVEAGGAIPFLEPGEEFLGDPRDNLLIDTLNQRDVTEAESTDTAQAGADPNALKNKPIYPGSHFTFGQLTTTTKKDKNGVLINNLPPKEDFSAIEANLIILTRDVLEVIYRYAGPIRITSGYRSPTVNSTEPDSSATSKHLVALAADFVPKSGDLNEMAFKIEDMIKKGSLRRVWMEPMAQAKDHIHVSYTP